MLRTRMSQVQILPGPLDGAAVGMYLPQKAEISVDQKIPWWKSRTIWVGLAQALVGVLVGLGYMSEGEAAAATSWLQEVLGIVVGGLGVASIWGRVAARAEIKPAVLPTPTPPEPPLQA